MADTELVNRLETFHQDLATLCIAAGRNPATVSVAYVTKYLSAQAFVDALVVLHRFTPSPVIIAENRVQLAQEKSDLAGKLIPDLWRSTKKIFIGNVQKNKITTAIELFDEIHGVDSIQLGQAIDVRLQRVEKRMPVFLEINISGEKNKHGIPLSQADETIEQVRSCAYADLQGLMTMAPLVKNSEEARPIFTQLRQLADRYGLKTSMGMSNDWKVAVEQGSDVVRIGSLIFL